MAEETHLSEPEKGPNKRRIGNKKSSKGKKKPRKTFRLPEEAGNFKPKKIDKKMKKLFRKRAREYNSDDETGDEDEHEPKSDDEEANGGHFSSEEEEAGEDGDDQGRQDLNADDGDSENEEDDTVQPGIMKFTEGCRAFRMAFKSIIKKSVQDDALGPVLSAHKKLVAEKLAEEETERKVNREAKKEKHLVAEKGHVKPLNYLDSHEKFLLGVATKGVVKLFNAVNKAQNAQKGLNPSRTKDAKVIKKRRKEAFFSELGKTPALADVTAAKGQTSSGHVEGEGPAWGPLCDNYMLTSSKLKDWDKKPDTIVADELGKVSEDSSSDDD
ncbi:uncharacterized protein LOC107416840 [Ziziphus jujuba]|uniref:Uncharacterized protein LOC107416840 n=2 Tax=Ziziphus jujuba TaxID=326968 RepID=A0A6P3ZNR4_ZIZJJ|nr:uncharacterized protein LOC107416840 [Ziziphus jujuba]KAH7533531.1 hypothetical protein FEM48_Zijuj04G0140800 [Ziziphus jujuba var. spinosa]